MIDPTQIPKSIVGLATQTASKPIASFSEFISLKLFGKSIAKLKAEAENEYNKTKQQGEIETMSQKPFIVQIETAKAYRQYSNLGSTLIKATPLITAIENKVEDDNDVFWGFLEHSKEISNEEMQELIAKIIAGEYNNPGTYLMSTLHTVKMLGKNELKMFENVCSFLINESQIPQGLFSFPAQDFMLEFQVNFGGFQTLQSLGLFLPNFMIRIRQGLENEDFKLTYFDKNILFVPKSGNFMKIKLPRFYKLSAVGQQILNHLNPQYNEKYFTWLRDNYKIPNYKLLE